MTVIIGAEPEAWVGGGLEAGAARTRLVVTRVAAEQWPEGWRGAE